MIAVSMIVSISNTLTANKGAVATIGKLVTGLVLVAAIVSPWKEFHLADAGQYFISTEAAAASIVNSGEEIARTEFISYIKKHIEAYILDKASELSLDILVDVTLSEGTTPSVQSIDISGSASPYARRRLTQQICKDLGISEDQVIWT